MAPSQHISQALPAEVRPQPRVTPDSATRAVYEKLFGCPAQFASIAEVHPDSQGPAGDANVTPFKGSANGVTPATMLAVSAFTEHSDQVKSNEKVVMVGYSYHLSVLPEKASLQYRSDTALSLVRSNVGIAV